jgi:hypothetical protein
MLLTAVLYQKSKYLSHETFLNLYLELICNLTQLQLLFLLITVRKPTCKRPCQERFVVNFVTMFFTLLKMTVL